MMRVKRSHAEQAGGPVFIVGMNGSGTTMLHQHLGQHPELFAFPQESYVLPHFIKASARYGDLADDSNFRKLWQDMASSFIFRFRNDGEPLPVPDDWRETSRTAAAIFDRIMHHFAAAAGKQRWSEKTPMHVLHIQRIAEDLPASRFVHMIRDGRDCAASDHRRWGRNAVGTMSRWKHAVMEGRRQGQAIGARYLEIRYEDITAEPETHLRQVCEFLGLAFDEEVLAVKRTRERVTGKASKTIVSNTERNVSYFTDRRLQRLEQVGGRTLADLGYTVKFVEGDADPSALARAWWTVHDSIRVFFRHLHRKMTIQKRMSWSLLFRRWSMIIKSKLAHK
jgi:hypothetical protein